MFKLSRFFKNYKIHLILGPAFKLTEAVFELIVPLVMADIIDVGVKNGDIEYVWRKGALLLLLGAVGLACSLTCQRFAAYCSQGYGTDLRDAIFKKINTLSQSDVDKIGTPSLITRITSDTNQMQLAVAMLIRLVIRAPFLMVGAVIMAIRIDKEIALVFLGATLLIAAALYIIMTKSVPFYKVLQKKLDKISRLTRENLSGARVVRAFSAKERETKRFEAASEDYTATAVGVGKISALLNPTTMFIINIAIIFVLWFGGYKVNSGRLEQGQIIALINYMTQILYALTVVANLVVIFTKASASAARINEIFETEPSVKNEGNITEFDKSTGTALEFKNVSFSYNTGKSEKNVLSNVSFSVPSFATVGIIGATGSGKSTLVNLIPRLYDADEGEVLVCGKNVREYDLEVLRKNIGVVPQKAVLFSGTLAENIRWGKPDADESEIHEALKLAQAEDFVSKLDDGINTKISQGGKNLSGGQRQRLTIARAVISKPAILILDDSASALDFATDAELRKALRKMENTTKFIISQRVTTIKNADIILVLDNGVLQGCGTHSSLLESCEVYKEICASQLDGEKTGGEGQ